MDKWVLLGIYVTLCILIFGALRAEARMQPILRAPAFNPAQTSGQPESRFVPGIGVVTTWWDHRTGCSYTAFADVKSPGGQTIILNECRPAR
jgi:hypothetical protein